MKKKIDETTVVADMEALGHGKKQKPRLDLSRKEARQAIRGALMAGLTAGALLCAAMVLLVLFMTRIWLRVG